MFGRATLEVRAKSHQEGRDVRAEAEVNVNTQRKVWILHELANQCVKGLGLLDCPFWKVNKNGRIIRRHFEGRPLKVMKGSKALKHKFRS